MELLEKVLSKDNLNKAYKQVYKNKGACGVDGITIDELFAYIKEHQKEILLQIRNRKYKPQKNNSLTLLMDLDQDVLVKWQLLKHLSGLMMDMIGLLILTYNHSLTK